jgi:four helix bundle protein
MRGAPQAVKDLKIWQKSIVLVEQCYRVSANLPLAERFGLTSQIRRASTSVPANIAEGFGRWTTNTSRNGPEAGLAECSNLCNILLLITDY